MFKYKLLLVVLFPVSCGLAFAGQDFPKREAEVARLTDYVRQHGLSPAEYIVAKFADHDIILIGEYHRVKHDPLFIRSLIPILFANGIRRLGFEFAVYGDQELMDRLLTAEAFDESLANQILWNCMVGWGYQEYREVLRAAWEVNSKRKKEEKPFRIIGLFPGVDWSHVKTARDRRNPEIMRMVWGDEDPDAVYARAVQREMVDAGEKGLVYAGQHHCFTRYHQPLVNRHGKFVGFEEGRMGNRIYQAIGGRCMTVCLHAPWPPAEGYAKPAVRAADGIIDAIIEQLHPEHLPVALDTKGTPLGALTGETSIYKHGYDRFTLADFCDGYIMINRLSEYEGVSAIPDWFTDENRAEAIAQLPDPQVKGRNLSAAFLNSSMTEVANMRRRFQHLLTKAKQKRIESTMTRDSRVD